MKRLWLGMGLLALLLAFSLGGDLYVRRTAGDTAALLDRAWDQSLKGNRTQAEAEFRSAGRLWERRAKTVCFFTDHAKTAEISRAFQRLELERNHKEFFIFCRILSLSLRELEMGSCAP